MGRHWDEHKSHLGRQFGVSSFFKTRPRRVRRAGVSRNIHRSRLDSLMSSSASSWRCFFLSILKEEGDFSSFFNTVDFGIVVIALPALWTMSSGIKYKQCCHSTQSHTCESWRNKSVAMKRHRIRVAVVFVCFLQYFFFFFFILLYMADTEWESVCRKQLNTVTYSATVHYCHHKFLFISFTTSFQLSGSFFFLLILFFSYKIIQSVSSREDIIDGISLIRLNVKQEGL